MPPPSQKTLELRLVVSADTMQGNLALQQLAAQATRVEQAAGKAGHAIGVANRGGAAGVGAGAAGGGGPGIGGAMMGMAGAAAGWLAAGAAVVSTISNMTAAVQGLNNPMLTAREQALGFAKALPIVGGALASLIDNAMDAIDRISDPETAARVDRARIEDPILMAQEQARFELKTRGAPLIREAREAGNRLTAIRNNPTIDYTLRDNLNNSAGFGKAGALFSYANRQEMDPRLRASEDAIQAAKRGLESAQLNAAGSQIEVDAARRAKNRALALEGPAWKRFEAEDRAAKDTSGTGNAIARVALWSPSGYIMDKTNQFRDPNNRTNYASGAFRALGGTTDASEVRGSKFSREDAIGEALKANQRSQNALNDLESKSIANKERQVALLQKQAELKQQEVGYQKVKLQLLDEEIAKVRGGTTAFVAMDKVSQGALLEAAQRFDKGGRENVTGEELSMLRGNPLTNDLVEKRLKKDAIDNGGAANLLKITGQADEADLLRRRGDLKAKIDMDIQLNEVEFAKVMEAAIKKMNLKEMLGEILSEQFTLKFKKATLDSARGRLEGGS